jgi:hypothetical protein
MLPSVGLIIYCNMTMRYCRKYLSVAIAFIMGAVFLVAYVEIYHLFFNKPFTHEVRFGHIIRYTYLNKYLVVLLHGRANQRLQSQLLIVGGDKVSPMAWVFPTGVLSFSRENEITIGRTYDHTFFLNSGGRYYRLVKDGKAVLEERKPILSETANLSRAPVFLATDTAERLNNLGFLEK